MLISRLIRKLFKSGIDLPPVLYSRVHGEFNKNIACLTFDDGPHPKHTMDIMDILDKHSIKAIFFCIGEHINEYYKIAEQIIMEKHSIQNHSFSHADFSLISPRHAEIEIKKCRSVINGITGGQGAKLFRPPHGLISIKNIIVSKGCGESVVCWRDEIGNINALTNEWHNKCVLLGHDDSVDDIKKLDQLLQAMIDAGFLFVDFVTKPS